MNTSCTAIAAFAFAVAMSSSHAAVYAGSAEAQITLATGAGNLVPAYAGIVGSTSMEVTVENDTIRFSGVTIMLPSMTWSGSSTYTDPNTLEDKTISYSITTQATSFDLPGTEAHVLGSAAGGGHSWNSPESLDGSGFTLAAEYTLAGPTETVTGSFSENLGLSARFSFGTIYPAGADSITFDASHYYLFSFSGLSLIEEEVDGIDLSMVVGGGTSGINVLPHTGSSVTTLTLVPEPSVAGLAALGGLALLRRARRK